MQNEYRFLQNGELRAVAERTIRGYAAVFNEPSLPLVDRGRQFTERIRRGAFTRSLTGDIVGLYSHDPAAVLGRTRAGTMQLKEDSIGLQTEIRLPDTTLGNDVYELVKRGDLRGMSFGFTTRADQWNSDHTERELLDVDLREVSVVSFPAYPQTTVSARAIGLPSDAQVLVYSGVCPATSDVQDDQELRRLTARVELLRRL